MRLNKFKCNKTTDRLISDRVDLMADLQTFRDRLYLSECKWNHLQFDDYYYTHQSWLGPLFRWGQFLLVTSDCAPVLLHLIYNRHLKVLYMCLWSDIVYSYLFYLNHSDITENKVHSGIHFVTWFPMNSCYVFPCRKFYRRMMFCSSSEESPDVLARNLLLY